MLKRLILATALAAGLASPALAQSMGAPTTLYDYRGQPVGTPTNPFYVSGGGGGGSGGATGSVTAAGTNGSVAQAVQGITGGVPQNSFPAQYNSSLPTLASGTSGYLAVDSNGRLIQSPGASVSVSNFPATQSVTQGTSPWVVSNGGTFSVQNTAATPTGANSIGTVGLNAGTNNIGSITNITGTVSLPTGAATAANQTTMNAALAAIQQRAVTFSEQSGGSVAASGSTTGTSRDVGASPLYTKFNAIVASTQNGTLTLQGSNDNFTTTVGVATVSTTANTPAYLTAPVMFRYNRYTFANGSTTTAATVSVNTSYTAN